MHLAKPLIVLAVAAWVMLASAGCGARNGRSAGDRAMPATAADPETVQRIRNKYSRAYPESRVGIVTVTLDDLPFVTVGDLPRTNDLRENEIVTFIDGRGRVLTTGRIARVLPDSIHVRYADAPRGGRAPRLGDIALLRLPGGAAAL